MSILGCVFVFVTTCFSANCKHKNAFLQRTSTKTILTKEENLTELQASERVKNAHFGSGKMRNREKRAKRFLGRFFRALKYVNFSFLYYKIKENRNDCAILQMYTFFLAVYICNAHFVGWVSDVLERSRAERSRSDERSKERENDGLPK